FSARIEAQSHRYLYDEPIDIEFLTKRICDLKQLYTQRAGVRPFGVSLLIAGVDREPQLFMTDPSGAYWGYKATAIGVGGHDAKTKLEDSYHDDITVEEALQMALKILFEVSQLKLTAENVEIALVTVKDKQFRKLTSDENKEYLEKVRAKEGTSN
ncbi:MAG: proteasome subunit alpha, partial [Calditrichaeota bacterium]|nr:proteasome subunit alpha [Calditrichota bacterium]